MTKSPGNTRAAFSTGIWLTNKGLKAKDWKNTPKKAGRWCDAESPTSTTHTINMPLTGQCPHLEGLSPFCLLLYCPASNLYELTDSRRKSKLLKTEDIRWKQSLVCSGEFRMRGEQLLDIWPFTNNLGSPMEGVCRTAEGCRKIMPPRETTCDHGDQSIAPGI